ncbi:MAG: hypothetical protein GY847_38475 [Proteobacteria bacterium]|nr:hypothetical protein [Pseudomonadota bacterium]
MADGKYGEFDKQLVKNRDDGDEFYRIIVDEARPCIIEEIQHGFRVSTEDAEDAVDDAISTSFEKLLEAERPVHYLRTASKNQAKKKATKTQKQPTVPVASDDLLKTTRDEENKIEIIDLSRRKPCKLFNGPPEWPFMRPKMRISVFGEIEEIDVKPRPLESEIAEATKQRNAVFRRLIASLPAITDDPKPSPIAEAANGLSVEQKQLTDVLVSIGSGPDSPVKEKKMEELRTEISETAMKWIETERHLIWSDTKKRYGTESHRKVRDLYKHISRNIKKNIDHHGEIYREEVVSKPYIYVGYLFGELSFRKMMCDAMQTIEQELHLLSDEEEALFAYQVGQPDTRSAQVLRERRWIALYNPFGRPRFKKHDRQWHDVPFVVQLAKGESASHVARRYVDWVLETLGLSG